MLHGAIQKIKVAHFVMDHSVVSLRHVPTHALTDNTAPTSNDNLNDKQQVKSIQDRSKKPAF